MNKQKKVLMKAYKDPVFFIEHFCVNQEGKPYELEPQQKLFLRDRSPYKILFCSRRSGKTLIMIADILHKSFFRKNQLLTLVAPTGDQAKEFATTFDGIVKRSSLLQSSCETLNKMSKELTNGTRIKFATAGAQSGKKEDSALVGSGFNTLYLDECQSLDAEALSTIIPAVTGQMGQAEMIFSGTPRGKTGFFYENIKNAKTIRECYVNNGKAKPCPSNGDYSLHRYQITDMDEDGNILYSRSPNRLPVSELETIRNTIGMEKFRREICLDFVDDVTIPYYDELRQMAGILTEPPVFEDLRIACAGVDFGKRRNNSVLTVGVQDSHTNKWEIIYYKYWELGTKYKTITHYLNQILPFRFPNLQALAVDATGVGQAIVEQLDMFAPHNIYDIIFSQPMKVNLVENTINNLESRYVSYYPHKKLDKEMQEYIRETTDNDRIIYKKGESDDFIDSFNLCNLAITKFNEDGPKRDNPFFIGGLGTNILHDADYRNKRYGKR